MQRLLMLEACGLLLCVVAVGFSTVCVSKFISDFSGFKTHRLFGRPMNIFARNRVPMSNVVVRTAVGLVDQQPLTKVLDPSYSIFGILAQIRSMRKVYNRV